MYIFILGLIFGLCVQPLLDGFTSLILSFFEMIKSSMAVIINRNNQKMQQENCQGQVHTIGFSYEIPEEEIDDDI